MKKFIRKVLFFTIFCICAIVIPAYALDPYNIFHWNNIRNNGINPDMFIKLYLDPAVTFQGIFADQALDSIDGFDTFYEYGWWCDYGRKATIMQK